MNFYEYLTIHAIQTPLISSFHQQRERPNTSKSDRFSRSYFVKRFQLWPHSSIHLRNSLNDNHLSTRMLSPCKRYGLTARNHTFYRPKRMVWRRKRVRRGFQRLLCQEISHPSPVPPNAPTRLHESGKSAAKGQIGRGTLGKPDK